MEDRKHAFLAIAWALMEGSGRHVLSLVFFILLTRLLGPEEIGLFAMVLVVQAFLAAFVGQSMGDLVIQRPEFHRHHMDAAFWMDVGLAITLSAGTALAAGMIGRAMQHEDIAAVVQTLAAVTIVGTLGNVPLALMQREVRFKTIAHIVLLSQTIGGVVAVSMALAGFGVWSLVGNQIAETSIKTALVWRKAGWRPGLRISPAVVRELAPQWFHAIGLRVVLFARDNLDRLIIGMTFGSTTLGFYSTALRIVRTITDVFIEGIAKAVLSVISRMQGNDEQLQNASRMLVRLLSLMAFPALAGIAIAGPAGFTLLLGERWAPVGDLLPLLSVMGMGLVMFHAHSIILRAVGRFDWNLVLAGSGIALDLLLMLIALPYGLLAVIAALAIRSLAFIPVYSALLLRAMGITPLSAARQYIPGILVSALVALDLHWMLGVVPDDATVRFLAAVATAGLLYALSIALFARRLIGTVRASLAVRPAGDPLLAAVSPLISKEEVCH
ncbi:lipopolysaccharide biosynthesis protein [Skermanella mucosa]|uniref:lipopolysaccharide biosynthesis protein n=1 Tax=Skermanella mucosa TaxID=1789672 RepID=UPI00192B1B6D|nr:lipopolysaccharide biosynthesis protein [Skermanella mucosa]UEM18691.1 lipopolysaccharide biosynthesis protein [Skermanella mucosa]